MKRLPVRLDNSASDILESIAAERGISLSKAVNEIILEYGKEEKEGAEIREAIEAARAAEVHTRAVRKMLTTLFASIAEQSNHS